MGSEKRPIVNAVVATLACTAITTVAAIAWPASRELLKRLAFSVFSFMTSHVPIPGWLLCVLVLGTIASVLVLMHRLRRFLGSPPHDEYRQDDIWNIRWRWTYDKDGVPDDVRGYCMTDDTLLVPHEEADWGRIRLKCETCRFESRQFEGNAYHVVEMVKRQIDRTIMSRSGTRK